jgi:hypothetical protein
MLVAETSQRLGRMLLNQGKKQVRWRLVSDRTREIRHAAIADNTAHGGNLSKAIQSCHRLVVRQV